MTKKEAVKHFGSEKALADALGIWPQAVYKWPGNTVPKLRQFEIERLTEGKLRAADT